MSFIGPMRPMSEEDWNAAQQSPAFEKFKQFGQGQGPKSYGDYTDMIESNGKFGQMPANNTGKADTLPWRNALNGVMKQRQQGGPQQPTQRPANRPQQPGGYGTKQQSPQRGPSFNPPAGARDALDDEKYGGAAQESRQNFPSGTVMGVPVDANSRYASSRLDEYGNVQYNPGYGR